MSAETSTDLQWELMTAKDSEAWCLFCFRLMEHNISCLCIACSTLLRCFLFRLFWASLRRSSKSSLQKQRQQRQGTKKSILPMFPHLTKSCNCLKNSPSEHVESSVTRIPIHQLNDVLFRPQLSPKPRWPKIAWSKLRTRRLIPR